jgi:hypothetical protein
MSTTRKSVEAERATARDADRAERLERARTAEPAHVLARRWARWEIDGTTIVATIDLSDGRYVDLRVAERVFRGLAEEIVEAHNRDRGGEVARFVWDGMVLREEEPDTDAARFATRIARAYYNSDADAAAAAAYEAAITELSR